MINHRVLTVKNKNIHNASSLSINNNSKKQNFESSQKKSLKSSLLRNVHMIKGVIDDLSKEYIIKPRKQVVNDNKNQQKSSANKSLCSENQSKNNTYTRIHGNESKSKQKKNITKKEQQIFSKSNQLQQIKWLEKIVDSFGKYEQQLNQSDEQYIRNCSTQLFKKTSKQQMKIESLTNEKKQEDRVLKYNNIKIIERKNFRNQFKKQDCSIPRNKQNNAAKQKTVIKKKQNIHICPQTDDKLLNKQYIQKNKAAQVKKFGYLSKDKTHNKSTEKNRKQIQRKIVQANSVTISSKDTTKINLRKINNHQLNNHLSLSLENTNVIQKSLQIQLMAQNSIQKPKDKIKSIQPIKNSKSSQKVLKLQLNNKGSVQQKGKDDNIKYLVVKDSIAINLKDQQLIGKKDIQVYQLATNKVKSVGKIKKNRVQFNKRVNTEGQIVCREQQNLVNKQQFLTQKQTIKDEKQKNYNYSLNIKENKEGEQKAQTYKYKINSIQNQNYTSFENGNRRRRNKSFSYMPFEFSKEKNSLSIQRSFQQHRRTDGLLNTADKLKRDQTLIKFAQNSQQTRAYFPISIDQKFNKRQPDQTNSQLRNEIRKRQRTISDVEIEQILERTNILKGQLNRLTCEYKKDKQFLQSCNVKNRIFDKSLLNQVYCVKDQFDNSSAVYSKSKLCNREDYNTIKKQRNQDQNGYRKNQSKLVQVFNMLDQDGSQVLSKHNCNANALVQKDRLKFSPLIEHIRSTNRTFNLSKFVKQSQYLNQQLNSHTQPHHNNEQTNKTIKLRDLTDKVIQPTTIGSHFSQSFKYTVSLQPSNISNFQQLNNQSIVEDKYSMQTKSGQFSQRTQHNSIDIGILDNTRILHSLNSFSNQKSLLHQAYDFKKKQSSIEANSLIPRFSGVIKEVEVNKRLCWQQKKSNLNAQIDEINKIEVLNQRLQRYIYGISNQKDPKSSDFASQLKYSY